MNIIYKINNPQSVLFIYTFTNINGRIL